MTANILVVDNHRLFAEGLSRVHNHPHLVALLEWLGTDPSGNMDSAGEMQRAVDSLIDGGTLAGHALAVYRLDNSVTISVNQTTFDMHNAVIRGSRMQDRIICNGDTEYPALTVKRPIFTSMYLPFAMPGSILLWCSLPMSIVYWA